MAKKKAKKGKKAKDVQLMTDEELEAEEEARKKVEQERLERERMLREMEEELRRVKELKKELDKKEVENEKLMYQILLKHSLELRNFNEEKYRSLTEKRKENEWQAYISCNHNPLANDPPALNNYLYTWKLKRGDVSMDNFLKESESILETIRPVDEYLLNPSGLKESTIQNLNEVKLSYYQEILDIIDKISFDAFMNLEKYHKRIGPNDMEVFTRSKNVAVWFWGWALGGISERKKANRRPSRKSPLMRVVLPGLLEVKRYHMRIIHTSFDPYSSTTESYRYPPYANNNDLYQEVKGIRILEINALKERYSTDYDVEIMPWWFVADETVQAEKRRKEQMKVKGKKKKKPNGVADSATTFSVTQVKGVEDAKCEENKVPTTTKSDGDEDRPRTKILYSRSMTDLMERRKKECNGPEYLPEVDPINFLEDSDAGEALSDVSKERYKDLLDTEKNTTFRACMYVKTSNLEEGDFLKDMTKTLYEGGGSGDELSFTNRREFLDWESVRDITPDRDGIREELEEFLFGDADPDFNDGKVTFVKRNPHLRSIKELFHVMGAGKPKDNDNMSATAGKNLEEPFSIQSIMKPSMKVTNTTEMKEVELEISNVLDKAWHQYTKQNIGKLVMKLDPSSVNLRRYNIVGGVYQFDFFQGDPQIVLNKDEIKLQIHYGEHKLKWVPFDQVPKIRIDINLELDRKKSQAKRTKSLTRKWSKVLPAVDLEEDSDFLPPDDDLVCFTLNLPEKVIFFECPIIARWNAEKNFWTTEDTYDIKLFQEKNHCQFKLGKSGPFALAAFRFSCLPYEDFLLKPSSDWKKNPTMALELKTVYFFILFRVRENEVTIEKFVHKKSAAISHILGIPFGIKQLIYSMRESGIDIFPEWDSFLYVNVTMKKLKPLEEHMYHAIGLSCPAFEYSRSKLNRTTRDDKVFIRIRECARPNRPENKWQTLLCEPRRVVFVTGEEGGAVKEDVANANVGYRPDLNSFIRGIAGKRAQRRMNKASTCTITTVIDLITATKLLSYS